MTFYHNFDTIIMKRMVDCVSFGMFCIVLVFAIIIVLGLVIIGIYNKLTFLKNRVLNKFDAINDCLNERIEIIRKIADIIGDYHEENLIIDLNKLSREINDESIINNLLLLISKSDSLIKKALSLDSVYPELKIDKNYSKIIEEFKNNQYKIMYSIEIYNEEVEVYNNYKNIMGINIISKIFRFKNYNYYKK